MEDVLQEVRLEVFCLLQQGRFRGDSSLRTYLCRVTAHSCIDAIRRRARRPAEGWSTGFDDSLKAHDPSPLDDLVSHEIKHRRHAVVAAAAPECHEIWKLVLEGVSYREMARQLGVSEGALRVRAHRCRKQAAALATRLLGRRPDVA